MRVGQKVLFVQYVLFVHSVMTNTLSLKQDCLGVNPDSSGRVTWGK